MSDKEINGGTVFPGPGYPSSFAFHSGQCPEDAPANNKIKLAASASAEDDYYNAYVIRLSSGAGMGQSRLIIDYDGNNREATLGADWDTNPVEDDTN